MSVAKWCRGMATACGATSGLALIVVALIVLVVLMAGNIYAWGQDMPSETPAPGPATPRRAQGTHSPLPRATHTPPVRVTNLVPSVPQPSISYTILFRLSQMENDRTVSRRKFEMAAETGAPPTHVHVGRTVTIGDTTHDLGFTIDAQLIAKESGSVELRTTIVQSTLAKRKPGQAAPDLREAHLQTTVTMQQGQSVTLGSLDDPGSDRHYQVVAVLTRRP